MILGAHESISGGLHLAFERATLDRCLSLQIFTKNANQWRSKPLTEEDVHLFKEAWEKSGIVPVVAHDSYLINLASPDDELFRKSIYAFTEELLRCDSLGIPYLITHPGSSKGEAESFGIERVAVAIDTIYEENPGIVCSVALETTAGQGNHIGYRFEQLRDIRNLTRFPEKVFFCVDTCHIFAAGYDIKGRYEDVIAEIELILGIDKVIAIHLNDSKTALSSRVDRHEHIGKGNIGEETFARMLNDPRFKEIPGILETPPLGKGVDSYRVNLKVLRDLIHSDYSR